MMVMAVMEMMVDEPNEILTLESPSLAWVVESDP